MQAHLAKQLAFIENQHSTMLHLAPLCVPCYLASRLILYYLPSRSTCDWCAPHPPILDLVQKYTLISIKELGTILNVNYKTEWFEM
jgi:hypothetical protein